MKEYQPVYYKPLYYAAQHEELEQYYASHYENIACRDAIEIAIKNHYKNNRLDSSAVHEVIDKYGYERTLVVLARTIADSEWDGRYSNENKIWAKSVDPVPDPDTNNYFRYQINSHPGLVDLFTTQVRREYERTVERPSVKNALKENAAQAAAEPKPKPHKKSQQSL